MNVVPITKKLIAFGSKKIYLPKFTIALMRNRDNDPYTARFRVPLDFSKYDLRDYLYHAYNVRCFNIRSFVRQMHIRDKPRESRQWFRPESEKYMMVELEEPFVWPEVPKSLAPWGKDEMTKRLESPPGSETLPNSKEAREAARILKEQAQTVLQGTTTKSRLKQWEKQRTWKVAQGDRVKDAIIKA